jgi:hypothetical protein
LRKGQTAGLVRILGFEFRLNSTRLVVLRRSDSKFLTRVRMIGSLTNPLEVKVFNSNFADPRGKSFPMRSLADFPISEKAGTDMATRIT